MAGRPRRKAHLALLRALSNGNLTGQEIVQLSRRLVGRRARRNPNSGHLTLPEFISDDEPWILRKAETALPGGHRQAHEDLKDNLILALTQLYVERAYLTVDDSGRPLYRPDDSWSGFALPVTKWKAEITTLIPKIRGRRYGFPIEGGESTISPAGERVWTPAEGGEREAPLLLGFNSETGEGWYPVKGKHEPTLLERDPRTGQPGGSLIPRYMEATEESFVTTEDLMDQGNMMTAFFNHLGEVDNTSRVSLLLQFAEVIGAVSAWGDKISSGLIEQANKLKREGLLKESQALRERAAGFKRQASVLDAHLEHAEAQLKERVPLATTGTQGYSFEDIEKAFPILTRSRNLAIRDEVSEFFQRFLRRAESNPALRRRGPVGHRWGPSRRNRRTRSRRLRRSHRSHRSR